MTSQEAIDKVSKLCRLRHMSLQTERSYCGWVRRFSFWVRVHGQPLPPTPAAKMEGFLSQLAQQGVAAATQNQAFNSLLFFYRESLGIDPGNVNALRARRPPHIRHAPTVDEVRSLLANLRDVGGYPTRLIVRLIYGCGLRVTEPLNIRLRDLDPDNRRIIIRGAKGGKDRAVTIPASLVDQISEQTEIASLHADIDRASGLPVALPGLLAKKNPRSGLSRGWAWLFPARSACQCPRTGATVRWRCHEANVQRCVRQAAEAAGLDGHVTPHNLRHAYATHAADRGASMRDIQEALGHSSLETTMVYLHPTPARIPSPLDLLTA